MSTWALRCGQGCIGALLEAVSLCAAVFSRGLKKSSQELYGLICYGELRKKIGGCECPSRPCDLGWLLFPL